MHELPLHLQRSCKASCTSIPEAQNPAAPSMFAYTTWRAFFGGASSCQALSECTLVCGRDSANAESSTLTRGEVPVQSMHREVFTAATDTFECLYTISLRFELRDDGFELLHLEFQTALGLLQCFYFFPAGIVHDRVLSHCSA